MKNSQIKILTKGIISSNIGKSSLILIGVSVFVVLFTALPYLVSRFVSQPIICSGIVAAVLILNLLTYSALRSGICAWFRFYNSKNKAARVLFWFSPKRSVKSARVYISLFIRKFMWTILLLLPGVFTVFSFVLLAMDGGIEFNLFLCGIISGTVMIITGMVFRFIIVQKYFLVKYLLVSDPKIKIRQAMRKSADLMNGNLKKTALFKLSFTPWLLLCVAVIPAVYVWPYYKQSCSLYANKIVV